MHTLRNGLPGAWFALLMIAVVPGYADDLESACPGDCAKPPLIENCWQPGTSYPTKLVPQQPAIAATMGEMPSPRAVLEWQPPDNHWYTKLRGMRELRLLTLWKSDDAQVFLGVSERGVPGLALSSRRRPGSGSSGRNQDNRDWRRQQASLIYY
jgi:hypothetical protein